MDMQTDIVRAIEDIVQKHGRHSDKKPTPLSFCTHGVLSRSALHVTVAGVGRLDSKKLTDEQLTALQRLASPAAFGLGSQTLVDPAVRDTLEIAANLVSLEWQERALADLLTQMRAGLGLPADSGLSLHLHNLLIYGEGQFFKPHQDTEKHPGMVASLVVVLPSAHVGGDLLVQQKKNKHTFSSEHVNAKGLAWLAFYADCQHEVKPVMDGFRVTLAFNVVLEATNPPDLAVNEDTPRLAALAAALQEHLLSPIEAARPITSQTQRITHSISEEPTPKRVVYYLDHQYTEHGLRWGLLKGSDRQVAQAFLQTAQQLGLKTYLALADIRETWTAQTEDPYERYLSNNYDDDEPEPGDFIQGSQSLDFWVNSQNHIEPYGSLLVRTEDVCWSRENDEDDLVESDYEGYMGNYGNTLDYWYRRAAVVVWPIEAEIAMHFELHFEGALKELVALTDPQQAQATFAIARPWLLRRSTMSLFQPYASLAVTLQNPELATALMTDFSLLELTPAQVPSIQHLQRAYGEAWLHALLTNWEQQLIHKTANFYSSAYSGHSSWFIAKNLLVLMNACAKAGIAKEWLQRLLTIYSQHYQTNLATFAKATRLTVNAARTDLSQQLLGLLEAAWAYEAAPTLKALVNAVLAQPRVLPPASLAPVLIDLHERFTQSMTPPMPPPMTSPPTSLLHLAQAIQAAVNDEIKAGLQGEDDQSMTLDRLHCYCSICSPALAFLASPHQTEVVLPMAEAKRNHVQTELTQQDMGLSFDTLRNGSPHKLVITKPKSLYKTAKTRFDLLLMQQQALSQLDELFVWR